MEHGPPFACDNAAELKMLGRSTHGGGTGGGGRLEETLTRFGQAFMALVLAPDMAATMPLLIVAVAKERGLATRFYEAGPGHTRRALAAFLEASVARGELTLDNATDAADDLLALWLGDMPMRMALGLIGSLSPAEIEQRARRGVAVFLRATR